MTLVRFDEVYHTHFRCNHRRIVEYPRLWDYARELYQWPGVARTVAMEQIKRHYYTTHDRLNPTRKIRWARRPAGRWRTRAVRYTRPRRDLALRWSHHRGAASRLAARLGTL